MVLSPSRGLFYPIIRRTLFSSLVQASYSIIDIIMSHTSEQTAVTALFKDHPPCPGHKAAHHHVAVQVFHSLKHEHHWTDLEIHDHSASGDLLPRPIISGTPARHVYMHPDDQIKMLKQGLKDQDVPVPREWVLPTHLEEKWSIKKLAHVFDAIEHKPQRTLDRETVKEHLEGKARAKRVLLAILGDDSTIVYYIVHDGIVKPRQN